MAPTSPPPYPHIPISITPQPLTGIVKTQASTLGPSSKVQHSSISLSLAHTLQTPTSAITVRYGAKPMLLKPLPCMPCMHPMVTRQAEIKPSIVISLRVFALSILHILVIYRPQVKEADATAWKRLLAVWASCRLRRDEGPDR